MTLAAGVPMVERDLFRRILERVLPWIDPAEYDRERARSRKVLDVAHRVLSGVPEAYRQYDGVVRR